MPPRCLSMWVRAQAKMWCRCVERRHPHPFLASDFYLSECVLAGSLPGYLGNVLCVFYAPTRGFCTRVFVVFCHYRYDTSPTSGRWRSVCFAMDKLSRREAIPSLVVCIRRCCTVPRERAPHGCGGLTLPHHSTQCCMLYGRRA